MEHMDRVHPLSVPEAAASLNASEAYVRRLLITQRLFGIKVGPVWGIYADDLDSFKRSRRPPGRPRKARSPSTQQREAQVRISSERAKAGTSDALLRPRGRRQG